MTKRIDPGPALHSGCDRRDWLKGLVLLGLGMVGAGEPPKTVDASGDEAVEQDIRRQAKAAGLGTVRAWRTPHYLGVGDAPREFSAALRVCESLSDSFRTYFHDKGFEIDRPARRMTVIVLAGSQSYRKFKGEPVGTLEGGHYDVASDRLVMFDAAGPGGKAGAQARRVNTFTLVHERSTS